MLLLVVIMFSFRCFASVKRLAGKIIFEVTCHLSHLSSTRLSVCLSVCLSGVYVYVCLSVCLFVCVYVSVCLCVVLVLSHNQIAHIDVATLSQLVKLQLSHNRLKAFPDVRV